MITAVEMKLARFFFLLMLLLQQITCCVPLCVCVPWEMKTERILKWKVGFWDTNSDLLGCCLGGGVFFTFVLQTQAHTNLDVNNKIVCPKKTNNMPNQIMAAIEKKSRKKTGWWGSVGGVGQSIAIKLHLNHKKRRCSRKCMPHVTQIAGCN